MASTVDSRPAAALAATCRGPGCHGAQGGQASSQHRQTGLPGRIRGLHQVRSPAIAGQVTIAWQNPSGLAMNVVRRGPAHDCPKTPSQGTGIGGIAIRTRQTDRGVPAAGYCYSVFALDAAYNFSAPAARSLAPPDLTPPSSPTDVRVSGNAGRVVIRWAPSSGHPSAYVVRRSAQGHCPTQPIHGAPIDAVPATGTTVVDHGAAADTTYCYAVFAVDRAQNVSRPGDSSLYLVQPTRSHPVAAAAPAVAPAASSGAAEIARIVAAVAVGVIVFGLIVLGGILVLGGGRRRTALRYGDRAIPGLPSLGIDRYEARAMIIPCALAILGLAVVLIGFMS